jgi:hypothetical protein
VCGDDNHLLGVGNRYLGPPRTVAAEVAEVFMATQVKGFMFAASNGEALSRALSTVLYLHLRGRFATGGRPGRLWRHGPSAAGDCAAGPKGAVITRVIGRKEIFEQQWVATSRTWQFEARGSMRND